MARLAATSTTIRRRVTGNSSSKKTKTNTKTKILPLLTVVAIVVVVSCSYVFIEISPFYNISGGGDNNSAVKLHLQEFRNSPPRKTSTSTNSKSDGDKNKRMNDVGNMIPNNNNTTPNSVTTEEPPEPFPIIMAPFNGSVDPFYDIQSDGTNLWDDDPGIPAWLKAYLNWHKFQRTTWDPNHWADDRWMIMQCLKDQDKRRCGGTADRLKPLPTLLRIAYEHHRMFLIRWTRPAMLETYLVPPKGGVDWRVPEWLGKVMANETHGRRFVPSKIIRKYAPTNLTLMRTRYQSNVAGKDIYNAARHDDEEPVFEEVFAPIWRLFFRPSPAIALIIQDHLESSGLVPGHYVAAHLRALYAIEARPLYMTTRWTINAVNCASQLRPGAPIFFTSDSSDATNIAQTYAAEQRGKLVIHTPHPNPPLHIDQDPDWQDHKPSDYYDTFVDLYLIALAGCVAYNKGGFGSWGMLIGDSSNCSISHEAKKNGVFLNECPWHGAGGGDGDGDGSSHQDVIAAVQNRVVSSDHVPALFLEPMP
jgi:hypothetical protein